jgi:hypothetical protein
VEFLRLPGVERAVEQSEVSDASFQGREVIAALAKEHRVRFRRGDRKLRVDLRLVRAIKPGPHMTAFTHIDDMMPCAGRNDGGAGHDLVAFVAVEDNEPASVLTAKISTDAKMLTRSLRITLRSA